MRLTSDDTYQGITKVSFINAWTSGDAEKQAGYLFDLVDGQNRRLCQIEEKQRKTEIKWATIAGGLAVLTFVAPLIVRLVVFN